MQNRLNHKISSLSFAFMLVISVVAFAFMIGSEVEMVEAVEYKKTQDGSIYRINDDNSVSVWNNGWEESYMPASSQWSAMGLTNEDWDSIDVKNPNEEALTEEAVNTVETVVVTTIPTTTDAPKNIALLKDRDEYSSLLSLGKSWKELSNSERTFLTNGGYDESLFNENRKVLVGQGTMKTIFSDETPFAMGQIWQGLAWSVGIIAIIKPVLDLFGVDKDKSDAITKSMMAGIMAGKLTYALIGKGGYGSVGQGITHWQGAGEGGLNWVGRNSGMVSGAVGLVTSWLVYNSQYEKESVKTETANFECLSWQAPHGGSACELCNDGTLPCSEYRCKALGQSCSIINKGTSFEMCVNTNTRDVSPPIIKPWDDALTEGFSYFDVKDMPPGAGFKIKSDTTTTGCVAPFTPIEFGITTDEPAQCKIDVEPKGNYSKMASYFGGDNLYSYNHTEVLSLPSVENFKNSSLQLENGKELKFYMRCRDSNGNANEADYELKVCIDPSPDTTAPIILGTSINSGGCVANGADNTTVQFYINEPAQCRWDFNNVDFDQMKSNMSCANSATEINALLAYTCNSVMTGIARDGTNFFVRCKDQPQGVNESKRNENMESYAYALRGSNPLKLKNIKPNETIYGAVRPTPVELYAETMFGCDNNKAICYYSSTGEENSYVAFFDTNKADGVHTQRLDLYDGTQTYFVKCVDSGGNVAIEQTTFKLEIDTNAPVIARVYEEDDNLLIVTPRNSECVFTNDNCDFLFEEGTVMHFANSTRHITPWIPDKSYYIKCRDEYRSEPVDCSLIVRPTDNFL